MKPASANCARCSLAVCGLIWAAKASSPAGTARPPISLSSMAARAGSARSLAAFARPSLIHTVCGFFFVNTSVCAEVFSRVRGVQWSQEVVMYTLFLCYTIDPNKLADWRAYAQAEFEPITESGGRITGYYAPTDFAGVTSEAFATIDVGTMAEYEVYRAKLAAHPGHQENVRNIEASGAIHSTYRASIQKVAQGAAVK